MKKLYTQGLIVGRFQNPHKGHEDMIRRSIALCEETVILIGSAEESGTYKNPYTYELRKEMLTRLFGGSIRVFPLIDIGVGNCSLWGEYVLDKAYEYTGRYPDLMISGRESRRSGWFDGEKGEKIAELYIPKTVDISATLLRKYMLEDDFDAWKSYMSPALWDMYDTLKAITVSAQAVQETKSL